MQIVKGENKIKAAQTQYRNAVEGLENVEADIQALGTRAAELKDRIAKVEGSVGEIKNTRKKLLQGFALGNFSEAEVRNRAAALRSLEDERDNLIELSRAIEGNLAEGPARIAAAKKGVAQQRRAVLEATAQELTEELQQLAGEKFLKLQAARGLCGWSGAIENTAQEVFGPLRIAELERAQKDVLTELGLDD